MMADYRQVFVHIAMMIVMRVVVMLGVRRNLVRKHLADRIPVGRVKRRRFVRGKQHTPQVHSGMVEVELYINGAPISRMGRSLVMRSVMMVKIRELGGADRNKRGLGGRSGKPQQGGGRDDSKLAVHKNPTKYCIFVLAQAPEACASAGKPCLKIYFPDFHQQNRTGLVQPPGECERRKRISALP